MCYHRCIHMSTAQSCEQPRAASPSRSLGAGRIHLARLLSDQFLPCVPRRHGPNHSCATVGSPKGMILLLDPIMTLQRPLKCHRFPSLLPFSPRGNPVADFYIPDQEVPRCRHPPKEPSWGGVGYYVAMPECQAQDEVTAPLNSC